jgi:nucleoside-triphosphate--adenylate kinase
MDEGKLVPDDLIPRTVGQAEHLEEVVHVDLVINLDIPTDTIVERIADR